MSLVAAPAQAERILYASADGRGGYFNGKRVQAESLDAVLTKLRGPLSEKTVIQLVSSDPRGDATTVFRMDRDACNFHIGQVEGSATAPLVIRGIKQRGRWLIQIAADSIADIIARKLSCSQDIAQLRDTERPRDSAPAERVDMATRLHRAMATAARAQGDVQSLGASNQYRLVPCFHVTQSRHIAFEDLHFKDCWVSAIFIVDSSDIRVSGNFIEGSSYAIFAAALRTPPSAIRGFAIERNIWIQDNSGYGPGKRAPCKQVGSSFDCPGLMWTTIPWAVAHDTLYEHMNGGLFGSFDIGGGVVFRDNKVTNAYNGIRMIVSPACRRIAACHNAVNRDVEITGNDFIYIRDNPVEPETRAVNWTIARNRIRDSHAWFSFDGVGGGPIYIWGNVGWYTDLPGRECRDGPEHRRLQQVDFESGGWRSIAAAGEPPEAFVCARSRFGTIIKEGSEGAELDKDIYVFHNSWYVRIPLLREAQTGRIKYWNNAMHMTGCGVSTDPNSLCAIEPSAGLKDCAQYRDYITDDGTSMLLRCVDPRQVADPGIYDFRFNLSNKGFPAAFLAVPGRRETAFAGDPRFVAPGKGDFRLQPGSSAIGRGCIVEWDDRARGTLRCREAERGAASDLGAYLRSGRLYEGPK